MPRKTSSLAKNIQRELAAFMPNEESQKTKQRVARLETRKQFKEAEHRANLRNQYDTLIGESLLIPQVRAKLGSVVATNLAKHISKSKADLKQVYKHSVSPIQHEISR